MNIQHPFLCPIVTNMKNPHPSNLPAIKPGGFTLIELMFALAIAAILLGIAVPNMRSFMLNNRLTSSANELIRSFQTARTESAKLQQNVVVCLSADGATCTTTNYKGWIVFVDTNKDWTRQTTETLLETHTFDASNTHLFADNNKLLNYSPTGFSTASNGTSTNSSAFVICDSRGYLDVSGGTTGQSLARGIIVSPTGRVRVTRVVSSTTANNNGIQQLLTTTGGSCT
jgi:type IV fimbrial biogenesis protein FimT